MENCKQCNTMKNEENICFLCDMKHCSPCSEYYFEKSCPTCPLAEEEDEKTHCQKEMLCINNFFTCTVCGYWDKDVIMEAPWNQSSMSSKTHEFDGNLTDTYIGGKNAFIECVDKDGNKFKKNLQTLQYQGAYNSERTKFENGLVDIKKIARRENISDMILSHVKDYWRKFMTLKQNNKGSVRAGIIANCFYYGFIASNTDRTVEEVCTMVRIDLKSFKKGEKILRPVLYDLNEDSLNFEFEENLYQNRFIRLVAEMSLPFRYSGVMNDLYNKFAFSLRFQTTHNIVGTIFMTVVKEHFDVVDEAALFKKLEFKKNSYNTVKELIQEPHSG